MSLKFISAYPNAEIFISILFYDKKCDGEFVKQGWWSLNDGQTTEPYAGNLEKQNRYFYFFAEATDGHTWSGDYEFEVGDEFNQCLLDNTNCNRTVGFIELDIGSSGSKTVELTDRGWSFYNPPSGGSGGWLTPSEGGSSSGSGGSGWEVDFESGDDDGWETDDGEGEGDD